MYLGPLHQGAFRLQRILSACLPRRISRRLLVCGCVCCMLCTASWQSARAEPGKHAAAPQWVYMPAGARATYIGIHGGTVPVSLLTSRDGTHMVALVGQTGNDFLRTLKVDPGTTGALPPAAATLPVADAKEDVEDAPYPHISAAPQQSSRLGANATLLMAGTAVGAMPVIYATGRSFASLNHAYTDSLLFGISENSPLLEGSVKAPLTAAKKTKAAKRRLVRGSSETVN